MKKLLLPLILIIMLTAGCIDNGQGVVADVITIPDGSYIIHNAEPYAGSTTTMEFYVENQGRERIDNIELKFYELGGFTVVNLNCWKPATIQTSETDASCIFNDMKYNDKRKVVLTLQAPDEEIKSATSIIVKYYLRYDFTGHRQAILPLVDDVTMTEPPMPYAPSSPSDGPIVLNFEPPKAGEVRQGQNIVVLYWAKKNVPFEMKMNFNRVGSDFLGTIQPINISAGDVNIKLTGLQIARFSGRETSCNFEGSRTITSKEDVEVPGTLSCNFISSVGDFTGYYNTQIDALFKYTYEIRKEETFRIRPVK